MAKSYLENLLSEKETIILTARQHWFLLARSIFFELTAIIIILAATVTSAIFYQNYALIITGVGFVLMAIPVISMIRDILSWSNHQYLVTNRRVMQISGLINKNVADSGLDKVNDVMMEQTAFGRLFGYGDIEILTASEVGANKFKSIEHPVRFKQAMLNAKEKIEFRSDEGPGEIDDQDIPAIIAKLDALRREGIISNDEFQQKKNQLLAKIS